MAITVTKAVPTLVTQVAAAEVPLGEPVADTATLAGGAEPTGSIAFDLFGPDDLDCSRGSVFTSVREADGPGTYESAPVAPEDPGQYRFIATYSGDADNLPVSGSCGDPNESVAVLAAEPPGLAVLKTATPLSRPEPGGTFAFDLAISNTSGATLTLTAADDDIYGDVAALGTCTDAIGTVLAPGDVYDCTFPGVLSGNAGTTQTDVVTASAVDQSGTVVSAADDAVVTLTDVPPTATIDKSALPLSRVAPGGSFTFTVVVTNTSGEAATVTSLVDDVYGDLTHISGSSCASVVGTTLDPGGTATCTFAGTFTGAVGATEVDVVTVTLTDDDGSTGTADDDAVVSIVDAASTTTTTATPTTTAPKPPPATPARGKDVPEMASTGTDAGRTTSVAVLLLGAGLVALGLRVQLGRSRR
ncbi:MAG: hypothetical protein Q8K58_10950 [Acidimicrobiales bacterium]|nr:hypothetical protein [Acidimicrobiales bacterium]